MVLQLYHRQAVIGQDNFFLPDKNSLGDGNSHQSRQYSRVIVGSAAEG